jgi:hypothetical protein
MILRPIGNKLYTTIIQIVYNSPRSIYIVLILWKLNIKSENTATLSKQFKNIINPIGKSQELFFHLFNWFQLYIFPLKIVYRNFVSSNPAHGEVYSIQLYVIKVCQWLAVGWWFSPVSSTNKTGHNDITEILLKVALNTIA